MKKYIIASSIAFLALVSVAAAQVYTFTQDLSVGANGADVTTLQKWLISNGYDIPAVRSGAAGYGYFGTQTREAVRKFQEREGLPNTGYFGRLSRGRFHEKWSRPFDSRSSVINGIDAPTTLSVGQMGTWSVRATDPQNGTLSFMVDWGDSVICQPGYVCTTKAPASRSSFGQTSTFTHSYVTPGTYTVKFTVKNNLGLTAYTSATVRVDSTGASPLKIISPNGGETWQKGTTQTIRWNSPAYLGTDTNVRLFRATYADIKLIPYYPPCTGQVCPMAAQGSGASASMLYPYQAPYTVATNISINQNSYSWNVGKVDGTNSGAISACLLDSNGKCLTPISFINDGQYTIQICEAGTNNCDSSDKPFTIKSNSVPQVTTPNGGETWQANSAQYLRWTIPTGMDPMTRVDLYLDPTPIIFNCIVAPCPMPALPAPYTLDKNIPITMPYNWLVATDINNVLISAGDYYFRVCVAGSTTSCDASDQAFSITK